MNQITKTISVRILILLTKLLTKLLIKPKVFHTIVVAFQNKTNTAYLLYGSSLMRKKNSMLHMKSEWKPGNITETLVTYLNNKYKSNILLKKLNFIIIPYTRKNSKYIKKNYICY